MTFKSWIKKFEGQNSPIGDLANDIAVDKSFPNTKSYEDILTYLGDLDAFDGAVKAFNAAWELY